MSVMDEIITGLERYNPAYHDQSGEVGVADILQAMRGQFSGVTPDDTPYAYKTSPFKPVVSSADRLTGYASVSYDEKGELIIDSYDDWTAPVAFADTIKQAYL